eukprot:TRINITY_DN17980_c0_g1_i13.p1 TRINITY_DN17980_c0_g1~~TRINITY_DN17980_c0_g1_i13.p1  ORF type:complete len:109 (+),score=16.08 TRINITY_DN17980_c0_g1_i13:28-354(+)
MAENLCSIVSFFIEIDSSIGTYALEITLRRDDSLLIVNPLPRNLLPPHVLARGNDEKEKICMVQLLEQEVQKSNKGFRKPSNKPLFSVAVSFSFGISPRGKAKEEGKR